MDNIRERLMQTLEVAQRPMLQVENDRLRMTAGDIIQQMFVRGRRGVLRSGGKARQPAIEQPLDLSPELQHSEP